jgi:hypothetical protein
VYEKTQLFKMISGGSNFSGLYAVFEGVQPVVFYYEAQELVEVKIFGDINAAQTNFFLVCLFSSKRIFFEWSFFTV